MFNFTVRRLVLGVGLGLSLVGCASFQPTSIPVTVNSYGTWPAARAVSTFAFDRLPSQQARKDIDSLEAAAAPALVLAGFKNAPLETADVLVQLNQTVTQVRAEEWATDRWGWGWGANVMIGRRGTWISPNVGVGVNHMNPVYQHKVAVLLRDRRTGEALYESHADFNGTWASTQQLAPMFEAAMKDFPKPALNPRVMVMPLPPFTPPGATATPPNPAAPVAPPSPAASK